MEKIHQLIFLSFASFLFLVPTSCRITHSATQSGTHMEPLISMERTGCFGHCPIYKISIFETGLMTYEGIRLTERTGKFCCILHKKDIADLHRNLSTANLMAMKDQYPNGTAVPVDLPSTIVHYREKDEKKTITDYGKQGPDLLLLVEKELDELVKSKNLQSCDK